MARPDPISLRLPEALKSSLQASASEAGRSVNAEIRMRLEWSFEAGFTGGPTDKMLANEVESLRIELREAVYDLKEAMKELRKRVVALETASS